MDTHDQENQHELPEHDPTNNPDDKTLFLYAFIHFSECIGNNLGLWLDYFICLLTLRCYVLSCKAQSLVDNCLVEVEFWSQLLNSLNWGDSVVDYLVDVAWDVKEESSVALLRPEGTLLAVCAGGVGEDLEDTLTLLTGGAVLKIGYLVVFPGPDKVHLGIDLLNTIVNLGLINEVLRPKHLCIVSKHSLVGCKRRIDSLLNRVKPTPPIVCTLASLEYLVYEGLESALSFLQWLLELYLLVIQIVVSQVSQCCPADNENDDTNAYFQSLGHDGTLLPFLEKLVNAEALDKQED